MTDKESLKLEFIETANKGLMPFDEALEYFDKKILENFKISKEGSFK